MAQKKSSKAKIIPFVPRRRRGKVVVYGPDGEAHLLNFLKRLPKASKVRIKRKENE